MKKIVILAISAILAVNLSAQEMKKECNGGKQLSKEERVEFDIKRFTNELMLSDQQAEKFAVTYREYAAKLDELFEKNVASGKFEKGKVLTDAELDKLAKQRFEGLKDLADLQSKYYDKFRKDLSARQVEKVLQLPAPCGQKAFEGKPCCGKHDGKHDGKKCGKHDGPRPNFPQDGPHDFPQNGPHDFPQK